MLGEHYTPALICEENAGERVSSGVHSSEKEELELQDYRYEVQGNKKLTTLLNKYLIFLNQLMINFYL